jgi:hypothetical protein
MPSGGSTSGDDDCNADGSQRQPTIDEKQDGTLSVPDRN